MAISHVQPLLLLLVSLFFLPAALGVTEFNNCFGRYPYTVNVSAVEISPYPATRSFNKNVTITGVTNQEILDGVTIDINIVLGGGLVAKKNYYLCDITACPVAPGPFVLTFSNIFSTAEKKFFREYIVIIRISKDLEDKMCVMFLYKLYKSYASLLSQVTG